MVFHGETVNVSNFNITGTWRAREQLQEICLGFKGNAIFCSWGNQAKEWPEAKTGARSSTWGGLGIPRVRRIQGPVV